MNGAEKVRNDNGKEYSPFSTSDNWITRCDCGALEGTTLQRGNADKKEENERDGEEMRQISMEKTNESDIRKGDQLSHSKTG